MYGWERQGSASSSIEHNGEGRSQFIFSPVVLGVVVGVEGVWRFGVLPPGQHTRGVCQTHSFTLVTTLPRVFESNLSMLSFHECHQISSVLLNDTWSKVVSLILDLVVI
jgi:hypothetical protein